MRLIITQGVSASGKSTWAESFKAENEGVEIVCRDHIRWDIMKANGIKACWANWKFKWEKEVTARWRRRLDKLKADALVGKVQTIIIADTNLRRGYIDPLINEFEAAGFKVEVRRFDVTWEEAVRRDTAREHGVGVSVLAKQFETLYGKEYKPTGTEKAHAYIFDIDETCAEMVDRTPYEWDKVGSDKPKEHVLLLAGLVAKHLPETRVIFMSGRDGICFNETHDWIKKHTGFSDNDFSLFMRPAGDNRPDAEVKIELFEKLIRGEYDVLGVFDDRPVMCRAWRSIGLNVFQVGNPYIEF